MEPARPPHSRLSVHLAALGAVLIWSAAFVVIRFVNRVVDPLFVGMVRMPLAALPMGLVLLASRAPVPTLRRERLLLGISTLGAFVFFPVFITWGMGTTTAGRAAFISGAAPAFTALSGWLLARERLRPVAWLGVLVSVVGLAWLLAAKPEGLSLHVAFGDALVLLGTIAIGLSHAAGALLARRYPAWRVTAWALMLGAALMLPGVLIMARQSLPDARAAWAGLLFLGWGSSCLAYVLWYWALARGHIGRLGTYQFLQPVLVAIAAALLLDEHVGSWLGAAAILVGVVLVQQR